jgi:hypothetical protein
VTTGNNELWVATFEGQILRVDLAERRVVTRLKRFVGNEVSIASAGGYLWGTSVEQPTLFRINPDTAQIVERGDIDAAGKSFPGVTTSPDGTLWVAAAPDRFEERDPESGDILESYELPVPEGDDPNTYYRGGIPPASARCGPPSSTTSTEATPSYASNANEPADSEFLATSRCFLGVACQPAGLIMRSWYGRGTNRR